MLRERLAKYEYVEMSMTQQKDKMNEKLPDYENSLKILDALEEKKEKGEPFHTTYLLSDEVYTKAVVPKPEKVCIWLGAGVMAEYDLAEARDLLTKNRDGVLKIISELTSELAYTKDQITTTQVNVAHVYNHGVVKKKATSAK
ncbi:hypothetical protein WR25_08228 isoform C [Diploscapter pachys]|uniref:Prefoldin subunit 3 n=1 Tax=Diploscapter pachys TaxID=2018661 RepID=A0A2A2LH99_9BILA|nr:hypothetical protein WR25_08228 isoform A [Diploscapter pachys]PAV85606.1 hypothetical protein WR25_08228 isoform C [Diploscapter pachys]